MRDKAIGEMAEILFPLAERVIATHADNPRSASAEEIRKAASRTSTAIEEAADMAAALAMARKLGASGHGGGYYGLDIHCRRGDAIARSAHLKSSAVCEDTDYRD